MKGPVRLVRHGAPEELAPLADDETWIRVAAEIGDDAHRALAEQIVMRPAIELSVGSGEDLEVLRWYRGLRRLSVDSRRLRSLDGLRHVAGSLERLDLGDTIPKVSLRPLSQLIGLRRLGMRGTWSDPESLSTLVSLERLSIGSIDLRLLRPLTELRRFQSGLGTVQGLELLPEIGRLELVELYRLRGPHDLAPLALIPTLRYLMLGSTRSITTLPSFAGSLDLRWVALDEMQGITDLQRVADAPNLEVLLLIGMPQLDADSLRPLLDHPSLRAGIWGFGSDRRNFAAQDLVPLPPEPFGYAASRGDGSPPTAPDPWNQPDWEGIRHPTET